MGNLSAIYQRLSTGALEGDELDSCYVDAFEGRGDNPVMSLKRRLLNNPGGKLQILFSGYRGCGKSTELNKLQQEISNDFMVLNFSIREELDLVNLNYVELFVITMEKLFDVVAEYNIRINPQLFKSVSEWSRTVEIEKIRVLTGEASLEAGLEAEVSVPLFARFFGKMRTAANASASTKKNIIESIEPRLSDLLGHCNDLVREVKSKLPEIGKKGLIIIIEDLDKLSIEKSEELFFTTATFSAVCKPMLSLPFRSLCATIPNRRLLRVILIRFFSCRWSRCMTGRVSPIPRGVRSCVAS